MVFEKKTLRRFVKKSQTFLSNLQTLYHTNLISVKPCYNGFMTRDYFSRKGGPYFVGQTFSQHSEHLDKIPDNGLKSIPIIGKVSSLLKFPRLKRHK